MRLECFSVGVGMAAYTANHITWNGLLQAIALRYWLLWRRNGKGSKGPWELSGKIPLKLLLHVLWRRPRLVVLHDMAAEVVGIDNFFARCANEDAMGGVDDEGNSLQEWRCYCVRVR